MALIEINRNPSRKELTVFVLLLGAFLAFVGLLVHRAGHGGVARGLWVLAPLAALAGLWASRHAPAVVRWVYLIWMHAVLPIGWSVSMLLLAICYYLVLTPTALVLRLLGRRPLAIGYDPAASSYWVEREKPSGVRRYFRQF